MSTVTNPLSGLVEGLLQGHQLATQIHRQKQEDQAFRTNQALHEQNMSMQDIMNKQLLGDSARPINAGMVENPAGPGQASPVPGLPDEAGAPAFQRKADASRTVKYGGQSYELKTQGEQEQSALDRQLKTSNAVTDASNQAQMRHAQDTRNNTLKLEGGGVPATGLQSVGVQDGALMTRAEFTAMTEAAQKIRNANFQKLTPGEQLVDTSGTGATPGSADPNPGATPGPRVVATGGPPEVTGEFGAYLRAAMMKAGYTTKNAPPDLVMKATTDYAQRAGGTTETVNQWIADSQSSDPAVAAGAKKKLAGAVEQAKAGRPVINMTVPGLGPGTPAQANPQLIGDDFMKTLPPGTAAQVKSIANGSTVMPPLNSRGVSAQLRDAVYRYDPSYTDQRAQVRKAFTTGPDGKNVGALNTATVHLDQMAEAAKAMKNGSFQPGNELYNYIATKFGAAATTNYTFVMNALAGEAASALKGAATDPEIAHVMSTLKPGMSPEQAAGVANTGLHVFGAKLNTYQERFNKEIPNDKVYSPVLPSAKAVFDKYGINATPGQGGGNHGGTVKMSSPDGKQQIDVPTDQVAHYLQLGAKKVGQ